MTEYVICDLDGTLCDCKHRRHFLDSKPKDWEQFFEAMKHDLIVEPIGILVRILITAGVHMVFVSGRPEKYREVTDVWLKNNCIGDYVLHMRQDGDYRPDSEVKKEILDTLSIARRGKPIFVIDDRASVVKMWRENGITCLQVADGNY